MSWPPVRPIKGSQGHYVWREGSLVKVSDRVHTFFDAYVPREGYVDEHLGKCAEDRYGNSHWRPAHIYSKEQKAALMREHNVVEDGGFRKPVRRTYFT